VISGAASMEICNPVYVDSTVLPVKVSGQQLTEPVYSSLGEVSTKIPASSLTFTKPGVLQSSGCKRAAVIVASLVGILILAGLLAAVFFAFTNIQDLQNKVQELEDNSQSDQVL
jgi:hypothetical protein